ncbi:MAG TPA: cytochrome c maturation protein CcmE [Gemmatimonadota bacterium]|nr:cytochrome c maturation protein CcmE [Gemmatimonadota bacterium]
MKRNKKVWGAVGVVAVAGAVAMLLAGGLKDGVVYFLTPGEIVAQGTDAVDRPLRLGGQVKPGSVQWDAEALDLRFVVQDSLGEVPVTSTGAPPAMFRDGIGVVVEGSLRTDGTFESTNLMVKHSNEYQAPHGDSVPEAMYESLIRPEAGE